MISERIKTNATTITATLEEEGMMPVLELRDHTNLEEKDILLALGYLCGKEQVQLFSQQENDLNVMLVF